jgi:hypothetical protein
MRKRKYRALFSSDWNECLAPCRPFDVIIHHYPENSAHVQSIFRQYTGNIISLGEAVRQISTLLPQGLTTSQMDAYLEQDFVTYPGVAGLVRWCHDHGILFMVNTTGMIGYFQRALAKGYLPPLPVLAAHPLVRFDPLPSDPARILPLMETTDKAVHTAATAAQYAIDANSIFLMGDSGGDGPHFEWGARVGAHLIGSMTKPSLQRYCHDRGIVINHYVGHTYAPEEPISPDKEMAGSFTGIRKIMESVLGL